MSNLMDLAQERTDLLRQKDDLSLRAFGIEKQLDAAWKAAVLNGYKFEAIKTVRAAYSLDLLAATKIVDAYYDGYHTGLTADEGPAVPAAS